MDNFTILTTSLVYYRQRQLERKNYLQSLGDMSKPRGGELSFKFEDGATLIFRSKNIVERANRIIGAMVGDMKCEIKAKAAGHRYGINSVEDLKRKVKVTLKFRE